MHLLMPSAYSFIMLQPLGSAGLMTDEDLFHLWWRRGRHQGFYMCYPSWLTTVRQEADLPCFRSRGKPHKSDDACEAPKHGLCFDYTGAQVSRAGIKLGQ